MQESELRNEIVRVTRIMAEQGLARSSDGNTSVRLDDNRFLITPSRVYKATIQADDLIVIDWEGNVVSGRPGLRPTTETLMHLEAYRQRPDIGAVLHAHPPYATALTIAQIPFPTDLIPEVLIALGKVPTAPYATPTTPDLALSIRDLIKSNNSLLLSHHGSLCVAGTLEEALIALERLEHAAYTLYLARNFGTIVPLPSSETARLAEIGRRYREYAPAPEPNQ